MDFLQSKIWREFQQAVGREVFEIEDVKSQGDHVPRRNISLIKHTLPIVGSYFYIPRVEVESSKREVVSDLIKLAKENNVGWIRIEPETENALNTIKNSLGHPVSKYAIVKAPHDMQPRETFVIDISKSEEEILAGMKQKTRYNLNLAKKKNIKIFSVNSEQETVSKYLEEFLRLVRITSERDGIKSHPAEYYRQMVENIPAENLKIYLAEYEGKIIAANIVIFYKDTAIYPHTKTGEKKFAGENSLSSESNNFGVGVYLHGASDNEFRNVMAPYLLQWQQITDAKKAGCLKYDFGGIKTQNCGCGMGNDWLGITRFKLGFSPNTEPTRFPGCYDIIINPIKYKIYRIMQKIKAFF